MKKCNMAIHVAMCCKTWEEEGGTLQHAYLTAYLAVQNRPGCLYAAFILPLSGRRRAGRQDCLWRAMPVLLGMPSSGRHNLCHMLRAYDLHGREYGRWPPLRARHAMQLGGHTLQTAPLYACTCLLLLRCLRGDTCHRWQQFAGSLACQYLCRGCGCLLVHFC